MAHQILMLGGRRCGKTSILASIVYVLKENTEIFSVHDHTDYTQNEGGVSLSAKRIEIDNYLKNRKNAGKNNNFLVDFSSTKGIGKYHISTQIKGKSPVAFDFVDVQGEAMEVKSRFHNETVELVKNSDVFVIAIDTPYLMQDINDNINTVWNRTEEITDMLGNISIENENIDRKLIILCPVKCEHWTQHGQADMVTERVCKAYRRLINNWVNHKAVDIWVMPIETAGGIEHSKLLDGYRLFKNEQDHVGELCSINDLTGQIMLKNGAMVSSSSVYMVENEPDKSMMYDFTQIPLSWYIVNGKGFKPERCEQPAYHIFRFLIKKEENAVRIEQSIVNNAPWWKRWWKRIWSPPFGRYLAEYKRVIDKLEEQHLIKYSGDGFLKIEKTV